MDASNPFLILALVAVIANLVFTIQIMGQLQKRGIPVSILWARLYMVKYVHQYKKATIEETGKPGPLFYRWLVSINSALLLVVLGYISNRM